MKRHFLHGNYWLEEVKLFYWKSFHGVNKGESFFEEVWQCVVRVHEC